MTIDDELQNWARWVRDRKQPGRCRSIESRFVEKRRRPDMTPTGYNDYLTSPPIPPLPPVDALAAIQVETCMHLLPAKHKKALKLFYVYQADARWCARRLSVPHADWPEFLETARRRMLKNILRSREVKRSVPSHYLPPPSNDEKPEPTRLRVL